MKLSSLFLFLFLASCAPAPQSWQSKPDPRDTPAGDVTIASQRTTYTE